MWTRACIKQEAKDVLSLCYWRSFLVSLIIAFAGGGSGGGPRWTSESGSPMTEEMARLIITIIIIVVIVLSLLRVFVGYMLEVGGRKFYIQAATEDINLNYLGFVFKKDKYINVLKCMFLRSIYLILWTLLLIIPGIIKGYAYIFVPYILADNPNIEPNRAIELSNAMTEGHKLDMWILDLSFLGWAILAAIPFGLGIPFLMPYIDATYTQLYLSRRKDAIEYYLTTTEELNIEASINQI